MIIKKIILSLISLILISLIVNFSLQILKLRQASLILEKRKEELAILEKRNKELTKKKERVESQGFVEEEARKKLGMVKEGDTMEIIPKATPPIRVEETLSGQEPNWRKWWRVFFD